MLLQIIENQACKEDNQVDEKKLTTIVIDQLLQRPKLFALSDEEEVVLELIKYYNSPQICCHLLLPNFIRLH